MKRFTRKFTICLWAVCLIFMASPAYGQSNSASVLQSTPAAQNLIGWKIFSGTGELRSINTGDGSTAQFGMLISNLDGLPLGGNAIDDVSGKLYILGVKNGDPSGQSRLYKVNSVTGVFLGSVLIDTGIGGISVNSNGLLIGWENFLNGTRKLKSINIVTGVTSPLGSIPDLDSYFPGADAIDNVSDILYILGTKNGDPPLQPRLYMLNSTTGAFLGSVLLDTGMGGIAVNSNGSLIGWEIFSNGTRKLKLINTITGATTTTLGSLPDLDSFSQGGDAIDNVSDILYILGAKNGDPSLQSRLYMVNSATGAFLGSILLNTRMNGIAVVDELVGPDSSQFCMVIDSLSVVSTGGDMSGWQWELQFIVGNFNPYNVIADELVIYPDLQTGLNGKGLGQPDTLTFNPPLSSGSYSDLQNIAFYSATHQPGDTLCLVMQLHSENAACCPPDTICVVLPPGGDSQPCFFVQDFSLTCDSSGVYHYTFSVTNWSAFSNPGSDGVNVHIESALPAGVTVSPMDVAVSPSLGYGETSGPLTVSISGAPAQTDSVICLAMQLHGPWNDAIQNYEWCCPLDTLKLTLPECNTPVGEPDTTCIAAPDSMLDWWPMDEPVPGTVDDCASFNNVGTVFGSPVVVPGKVGNALRFDTEDDWVEVPNHPELNFGVGSFSIEGWINGDPAVQYIHTIIVKYDQATATGYVLYLQNQDLVFNINANSFAAGPFVRDGEWHHIAVTIDRVSHDIRFYVDGALLSHLPIGTSLGSASNNLPLHIGNFPPDPQFSFQGQIDELTFYNDVLSSQEIAAIWQADSLGKCKPDTLAPPESRSGNLQTPMLKQNYPNPFNPSTTIAFQLPEKAEVSVKVYDILGQEVAILAKREFFAAGDHQLNFYADKLGSGIYFYRITAIINGKQHREMRKMLLVK